MQQYPIVKWQERGRRVGVEPVYVCGNLHRVFHILYAMPGSWTETGIKWCWSPEEAIVEIVLNGYTVGER